MEIDNYKPNLFSNG